MSESQQYTLHWRGRESGPYVLKAIKRKLELGEISLEYEILVEGRWITLHEFFEGHHDEYSTDAASPATVENTDPGKPQEQRTASNRNSHARRRFLAAAGLLLLLLGLTWFYWPHRPIAGPTSDRRSIQIASSKSQSSQTERKKPNPVESRSVRPPRLGDDSGTVAGGQQNLQPQSSGTQPSRVDLGVRQPIRLVDTPPLPDSPGPSRFTDNQTGKSPEAPLLSASSGDALNSSRSSPVASRLAEERQPSARESGNASHESPGKPTSLPISRLGHADTTGGESGTDSVGGRDGSGQSAASNAGGASPASIPGSQNPSGKMSQSNQATPPSNSKSVGTDSPGDAKSGTGLPKTTAAARSQSDSSPQKSTPQNDASAPGSKGTAPGDQSSGNPSNASSDKSGKGNPANSQPSSSETKSDGQSSKTTASAKSDGQKTEDSSPNASKPSASSSGASASANPSKSQTGSQLASNSSAAQSVGGGGSGRVSDVPEGVQVRSDAARVGAQGELPVASPDSVANRQVGIRPVVFLVDQSYSMRGEKGETAYRELSNAVSRLDPKTSFYILFFHSSGYDAMPTLTPIPATPENVKSMLEWSAGVRHVFGSKPVNAVGRALGLNPKTVWLISDGKFSKAGVASITASNQTTHAEINAVAIQSHSGEENLRELAAKNGGAFRFVPAPGLAK